MEYTPGKTYSITSGKNTFDGVFETTVRRAVGARGKPSPNEDMHRFRIKMAGSTKIMSMLQSDLDKNYYKIEEK